MDFLDPKKRRAFHIRLIIGYILVAVVIGLGTVIIVYGANGYGINTKTGQIVQNGLFFADSKPGGAQIYLNGQDRRTTTSARLILPAGNYSLTLKKSGYRSWSRDFTLSEQSIARYVYPLLFPDKPLISNLKTYDSLPGLITQSPDQKWLLLQTNTAAKSPVFDVYDTSTLDQPAPAVTSLSLPPSIINNYSAASKLTEVEWSSDNTRLLLRHDFSGGSEFIIIDRSRPEQSVNINSLLGVTPSQVSLRDKKTDQLYIFNQPEQSLQLADIGAKTIAPAFLKDVLAYKGYGKGLVTYITNSGQPADRVAARIWDNGQTYKLNEFSAGRIYLIDAAQFQGSFYYAAGSDTSGRINIYKDPINGIKNSAAAKALPLIALQNPGASKLKFSNNARFIGTQAGQNFAVYDIETQTAFQYSLSDVLEGDMSWMDGHRLIGRSAGNILVMDYDGINKQIVAPTLLNQGGFFSRDYNHLLSISPSDDGLKVVLKNIDMRAGPDLPRR